MLRTVFVAILLSVALFSQSQNDTFIQSLAKESCNCSKKPVTEQISHSFTDRVINATRDIFHKLYVADTDRKRMMTAEIGK